MNLISMIPSSKHFNLIALVLSVMSSSTSSCSISSVFLYNSLQIFHSSPVYLTLLLPEHLTLIPSLASVYSHLSAPLPDDLCCMVQGDPGFSLSLFRCQFVMPASHHSMHLLDICSLSLNKKQGLCVVSLTLALCLT